ncbi:MAG TPA: SH3 domain-containing protein [Acidimicrobiales bacterium]|jgi:hypothetical protein|nr:SH3 domain-containing protein [Acidimicrobiales bacterium]
MTDGFGESHRVPQEGLPAWSRPDAGAPVAAMLEPGLGMQVVEQQESGWARVEFSNGWTAWVDGRRLVPVSAERFAPTSRRAPLVTALVIIVALVAAGAVVVRNRNADSSARSNGLAFEDTLPPVVVISATSRSDSTGAPVTSSGSSTSSSAPGSSSSSSSSGSSSSSQGSSSSSSGTTVPTIPQNTLPTTTQPTTTQPTTTTTTTTTTQPPQCFVPNTISITLSDESNPAVQASGDGVSGRTFTFQFGPNTFSGNATIKGLQPCGTPHYQMNFTAGDGSTQFVCGPPPTLSMPIQTGTPGDTASITVQPQPGC